MKKVLALIMVAVMLLVLAACASKPADPAATEATKAPAVAKDSFTIGIC